MKKTPIILTENMKVEEYRSSYHTVIIYIVFTDGNTPYHRMCA